MAQKIFILEQWSLTRVPWNPRVPPAESRGSARSYADATKDSKFIPPVQIREQVLLKPLECFLGVPLHQRLKSTGLDAAPYGPHGRIV